MDLFITLLDTILSTVIVLGGAIPEALLSPLVSAFWGMSPPDRSGARKILRDRRMEAQANGDSNKDEVLAAVQATLGL